MCQDDRAYLRSQATSGRLPHLPSVSAYYPVTTHQRPCVPTRHTTGIERPWCVDMLPSHISKMVVSTVCVGGPGATGFTRAGSVLTFFVESWFVFQACWFLHLRGFRSPFVQLRLNNKPDSRREDQPQDEYDPPVDATVRESLHCLTLLIVSI